MTIQDNKFWPDAKYEFTSENNFKLLNKGDMWLEKTVTADTMLELYFMHGAMCRLGWILFYPPTKVFMGFEMKYKKRVDPLKRLIGNNGEMDIMLSENKEILDGYWKETNKKILSEREAFNKMWETHSINILPGNF